MSFTSDYVKTTREEATAAADAIFEVKGQTGTTLIFVQAVEEDGEWTLKALESTISGKMATVPGFPGRSRDTKEEIVAKIDDTMSKYKPIRRIK